MSETMVIPTTVIQADEKYPIALQTKVNRNCGTLHVLKSCVLPKLSLLQYSLPPTVIFTKFTVVESSLLDAIGVDSDGFVSAVEPIKSVSFLHWRWAPFSHFKQSDCLLIVNLDTHITDRYSCMVGGFSHYFCKSLVRVMYLFSARFQLGEQSCSSLAMSVWFSIPFSLCRIVWDSSLNVNTIWRGPWSVVTVESAVAGQCFRLLFYTSTFTGCFPNWKYMIKVYLFRDS